MSETGSIIKLVNDILASVGSAAAGVFAGPAASAAVVKAAEAVDTEIEAIDRKQTQDEAARTAAWKTPAPALAPAAAERVAKPVAAPGPPVQLTERMLLDYLVGRGWTLAQAKELVKGHPVSPDTIGGLVRVSEALDRPQKTAAAAAESPSSAKPAAAAKATARKNGIQTAIEYLMAQGWDRNATKELVQGHPVSDPTLGKMVKISASMPAKTGATPKKPTGEPGGINASSKPAGAARNAGDRKSAVSPPGTSSKVNSSGPDRRPGTPSPRGSTAEDYTSLPDGPEDSNRSELRGSSAEDYTSLPDGPEDSDRSERRGSSAEDYTSLPDGREDSDRSERRGSSAEDYTSLPDGPEAQPSGDSELAEDSDAGQPADDYSVADSSSSDSDPGDSSGDSSGETYEV